MRNVLIFDVETTGLEPQQHQIIEVGCVLWSAEHRTVVECYSTLLPARFNDAEVFNAIPEGALQGCQSDPDIAWEIVAGIARQADCVLAHSASFDRGFVEAEPAKSADSLARLATLEPLLTLPWVCTIEDMVWPVSSAYRSLVSIALAHGVAVTSAHRAINDCLLLARLLERIDDVAERLDVARARAARPKSWFIARTTYDQKDVVKAHGFHWNGMVWKRLMADEDAAQLPFEVVRADALRVDDEDARPR